MHIANHGFAKITLFFAAGAIFVASGRKKISELGGIGYRMPFTMAAFGLASLSMIGIPPVAGFVSKWYLALGAVDIHDNIILAVIIISSLLNAGYFVPIFLTAFFGDPPTGEIVASGSLERTPLMALMVVPLFITAIISVLIGLWPEFLFRITRLMGGS